MNTRLLDANDFLLRLRSQQPQRAAMPSLAEISGKRPAAPAPDFAPLPEPEPLRATDEQVAQLRRARGVPSIMDFRADHIDDANERAVLRNALKQARAWQSQRKDTPGLSIIFQAQPFQDDAQRTGYGVGKTTLARACMYAASASLHWTGDVSTSVIHTAGRFFMVRNLFLALGDTPIPTLIPRDTPVVVLDDYGAERIGTLPYVAAVSQAAELQTRSFQIIDWCYQNKIGLVITTNESRADFESMIGGAAWSRLHEVCPPALFVSMTGVRDYRPYLGGHAEAAQ